MKLAPIVTAALLVPAGVVVLAVWPDNSTQSALAVTTERAVAASIGPQWPEPGFCVLMEATIPDDSSDAGAPIQRAYEVCHRTGYPESADPAAYYAERVEVECRQAARTICGMNQDAGEQTTAERVQRQQCSQRSQEQCRAEVAQVGVSEWRSEPYAWTTQPAIRRINRPGAIWRAHGCVCRATGGVCKYWPPGADAGVQVPERTTVPAATVSGAGCVDTCCVESQVREQRGPQMAAECRQ